jgi:hypothetical protein
MAENLVLGTKSTGAPSTAAPHQRLRGNVVDPRLAVARTSAATEVTLVRLTGGARTSAGMDVAELRAISCHDLGPICRAFTPSAVFLPPA